MTTDALPTVFVPGLFCTPRLYADQLPALWQIGPVSVADHRRDDSIAGIAQRLLDWAPPRFGLVGISMGGYVALEVMRRAPERVDRLALLCTSARPDTPEQTQKRRGQIASAREGHFDEVVDDTFPLLFAPSRGQDDALHRLVRTMADETGVDGFVRQQTANMGRVDSRPHLAAIRCPTLVLAGADDQLIPPEMATELANAIPGARHVQLPDCGHLACLDRPDEVTRALLALWRDRA